ncbi:MAG: putative PurR-regulated permease PerM [Oceanicoccus sp.]
MVFFGFSLLLSVMVLITLPMVGRQLDLLIQNIPHWLALLQQSFIPWLADKLNLPSSILPMAEFKTAITENWLTAGGFLGGLSKNIAGSSLSVLLLLANLILVPVVTFYLLRDWDVLIAHIRALLPRNAESSVVKIAGECDEIIGAFIRGQLLVMLCLGVVYALGLSIVGLELALILGLLAGLASIVPYMGFIVGIVAASIACWLQMGELMPLLAVAAVFGIGQMLEGMVLTPMMVGDRIGLHPVAVIFAIMAGGQLFGFTGVLLALPVAAVIMVMLRHAHRTYKDSELYQPTVTDL